VSAIIEPTSGTVALPFVELQSITPERALDAGHVQRDRAAFASWIGGLVAAVSTLDGSDAHGRSGPVLRNKLLQRDSIDEIVDDFGPSGDVEAAWRAPVFDTQAVSKLLAFDHVSGATSHLPIPTPETRPRPSLNSPIGRARGVRMASGAMYLVPSSVVKRQSRAVDRSRH
jgi:hypothetical protein